MNTLREKLNIPVSDSEWDRIRSCFQPVHAEKGELLVRQGQRQQRMYFVVSGCVRIFFVPDDGREVTRYLAFENEFATALVSFITEDPSGEYVQALEESELLAISGYDFQRLLAEIPSWEFFYRQYLELAYVTNTNRLMSFITLDAAARYRLLLQEKPEIVRRLPNQVVASYLRISPETLSRLKSRV